MSTDGQGFLDRLASFPANGFELRFANIASRHGLGLALNGNELRLLFAAAISAALCNIAFNGLGGCSGEIRSDQEANRIMLERRFMTARDKFYSTVGWQALAVPAKDSTRRIFLNIFVAGENLA
jgi:hypothetical protein